MLGDQITEDAALANIRQYLIFTVVFVLALGLGGCKSLTGHQGKTVIFISIDSLRADHLGCYGYDKPTSPRLDALAAQGIRFDNAYSTSPWTLPSHASMFTGLYVETHGINRARSKLRSDATTLAGVLNDNGYNTVAVVCAPLLSKRYTLTRGFDIYDAELIQDNFIKARRVKVADKVTEKALNYIDQHNGQDLFLFLHYWDPHYDYNPAKKYINIFDPDYQGKINGLRIRNRKDLVPGMNPRDLQHIVALYDGEIRYTDDGLGRLLDGLEQRGMLDKNTIIVITADHGEEFLEHGQTGHTKTCYEELVKVPLIFYAPKSKPYASVIQEPASTIDIFPTLLDLLDIRRSNDITLQGLSLASLMMDGTPLASREIMAETRRGEFKREGRTGYWRAVLNDERMKLHEFKMKEDTEYSLFDLAADPHEQENLINQRQRTVEVMKQQLSLMRKRNRILKRKLKLGREGELDENLKETLKGLGYL